MAGWTFTCENNLSSQSGRLVNYLINRILKVKIFNEPFEQLG